MSSKKIHVNSSSSLIDLKAELFRKQETLKAERLQRELGHFSKPTTPGPKQKKESAEKKQNAKRDEKQDIDKQDIDMLQKSREMLEKKAKIYNTLTKGNALPDDEVKELYLVDFERKVLQNLKKPVLDEHKEKGFDSEEIPPPSGPGEEWIDYVDALGRSRRCLRKDLPDLQELDKELRNCRNGTSQESQDQENELLKTDNNYKSEEPVDAPSGPVHYQTVRHNEIRTHGVGYFSFSTEEEQRKIQIESLKNLRDQTVEQRAARQRLKEKRKATLKARLTKVKQRKGIEVDSEDSDEVGSDKDIEMKKGEPIAEEKSQTPTKTRPWDIGKILPPAHRKQQFTQQGWIEKQRQERLQEFAPPQFYNLDAATFSKSFHPSKDCASDNQNAHAANVKTQEDIERIIAETVSYYKNKS